MNTISIINAVGVLLFFVGAFLYSAYQKPLKHLADKITGNNTNEVVAYVAGAIKCLMFLCVVAMYSFAAICVLAVIYGTLKNIL